MPFAVDRLDGNPGAILASFLPFAFRRDVGGHGEGETTFVGVTFLVGVFAGAADIEGDPTEVEWKVEPDHPCPTFVDGLQQDFVDESVLWDQIKVPGRVRYRQVDIRSSGSLVADESVETDRESVGEIVGVEEPFLHAGELGGLGVVDSQVTPTAEVDLLGVIDGCFRVEHQNKLRQRDRFG